MTTMTEESIFVKKEPVVIVSWTAVLAGLTIALATIWLMSLLGTAIGVSIADASDGDAVGQGLGIAAIGWLLFTGVLAFFLAGVATARIGGAVESEAGMLNGLTMWGASVLLMVLLAAFGVTGLLSSGTSLVGSTIEAGGSLASGAAFVADETNLTSEQTQSNLTNNPIAGGIAASLKREAAGIIAQPTGAGGAAVSEQQASAALEELDAATLQTTAALLLAGQTEAAKDHLAVNTSLSEAQVDQLVATTQKNVQQKIDEFKAEADKAVEAASTYSQAALWTAFVAAAAGLVAAILGGVVGAAASEKRHLVAISRRITT